VSAVATPTRRRAPAERPSRPERSAQRLFEPRAGGVSLEDQILAAWEDLARATSAECPVCSGPMRIASGCDACGSELS
jgi:hypothetical protein